MNPLLGSETAAADDLWTNHVNTRVLFLYIIDSAG